MVISIKKIFVLTFILLVLGSLVYALELSCNDGIDNDSDGYVDCADTNCNSNLGLCSIDIGLRIYDGTSIVPIACEPTGTVTSDLRIYKNGRIYGVILVAIDNPYATNIHIMTGSGLKALKRYV